MPSPRSSTNVLVVDASVLAPAVADDGVDGHRFRSRLRGEVIAGPDLLRIEVTSVLRRHLGAGALTTVQADAAFDDLIDLPIRVFPTAPLLRRTWQLRNDLSTYDACYAALAEVLDVPLLTADQRLAHAAGTGCIVEVI